MSETRRLERLWSSTFGDAYIDRNADAWRGRDDFWRSLLRRIRITSALEVGCNVGGNLHWLVRLLPGARLAAVDVNERALDEVRSRFPEVDVVRASAARLPFEDRSFELVFTTGVLIHLSEGALPRAMAEVVRCSSRYVLCGEYYAEEPVEVPYRGHTGALFKRDYGRLYRESFDQLCLLDSGFLPRDSGGWDDVTWWLFERR